MAILKKYNEFYYPETEIPKSEKTSKVSQEEMKELEELSMGKRNEVKIGEYTITKPSELDGGYVITNGEGKTMQVREGTVKKSGGAAHTDLELAVLDVLDGTATFESRNHRINRRDRL